jgi:hypothetical protein
MLPAPRDEHWSQLVEALEDCPLCREARARGEFAEVGSVADLAGLLGPRPRRRDRAADEGEPAARPPRRRRHPRGRR